MPIYEYECYECKAKFEKLEDDAESQIDTNCPECKSSNVGLSIPIPTFDDPSSGFNELTGGIEGSGGDGGCSQGNRGDGHCRRSGGFGCG